MASKIRLSLENYFADVVLDTCQDAKVFHWIVQKAGSPSVLYSGQESTLEEAQREAQLCLESCVRNDQSRPA